jgi:hypothetical protein
MKAIKETFGDVSEKEVVITVDLYEFFSMEAIEGYAVVKIKRDGVSIKALGKKYRAFKPKNPFEVVVCSYAFLNIGFKKVVLMQMLFFTFKLNYLTIIIFLV